MIETRLGTPLTSETLSRYFKSLVNCFFKILPIRESGEASLTTYMESLQIELIGLCGVVGSLEDDQSFLTLVSILQYLIDHPDYPIKSVKREVFKAINICNRLEVKYAKVDAE